MQDNIQELADQLALLERGTTTAEALAFYDRLPPAMIGQLMGDWQGSEIPTGHPLDGLLGKSGWQGKRFDHPDDAHPLVFSRRDGTPLSIDPAWLPLWFLTGGLGLAKRLASPTLLRAALFARTAKPRARLRMTEYRGVLTATMIYDALPINDVFRAVDDATLIGAMDMRGYDRPYLFALRRRKA